MAISLWIMLRMRGDILMNPGPPCIRIRVGECMVKFAHYILDHKPACEPGAGREELHFSPSHTQPYSIYRRRHRYSPIRHFPSWSPPTAGLAEGAPGLSCRPNWLPPPSPRPLTSVAPLLVSSGGGGGSLACGEKG
jgi:hypothetical protein